jgi:hypothetical protein
MQQNHSNFLADKVAATQLSAWADILPVSCRVLGANLFGDVFVADADGAIHMLEVSAGSIEVIAASEDEFQRRCVDDLEGWFLRPLADRCRSAGMVPGHAQCYAFTTLPLFGGKYEVDNIWICPLKEWLSFTAAIYTQTKELPDGATVLIDFVE